MPSFTVPLTVGGVNCLAPAAATGTRLSNLFVPVALVYLAVGSYGTLALSTRLPVLIGGYPPRVTHLLAPGTATLLVFADGARDRLALGYHLARRCPEVPEEDRHDTRAGQRSFGPRSDIRQVR